ncbi:MAG: hypothetical protein JWN70_6368 [Planctomycetaceae bacterium]|nr:hypothetical protein [Planctomycetaceae bacterium]
MRATNLPLAALSAAFCRRCLVALALIAASSTTVARASGFDHLSLAPQLGQLVVAQQAPKGGGPGQKQKKPKAAAVKPKVAVEVDPALLRDKIALPPDYQVPPPHLPDIDIVKELPFVTKKDARDPAWRAHSEQMRKYNALLPKGTFTDVKAERDILRYGIKYKLARMTQRSILFPSDEDREKILKAQEEEKRVEVPETIEKIRDDILKDVKETNAFNGAMDIRDAFLDILCEEAVKLYDNSFYVRFNVALILSNLNNRDEDRVKMIPEQPCFKAVKALLELVNDPKQHPMYKVHPVVDLAKICRHKDCKPEDRFAIIESLINQMGQAKTLPDWYGMRLAESMSQLGEPNDRTRQPVVVDALVKVLKDPAYSYRVRSAAAQALGRVPLEGYRKADEIAVEMLRLGEQMALDYEKTPKNPRWKLYFWSVYLGFQPKDAAERADKKGLLGQVDSKPVLAGTKTVVTEAYQHFLPLAQNVLGGRASAPIPDQLRKIKVWLDARGKPALAGKAG